VRAHPAAVGLAHAPCPLRIASPAACFCLQPSQGETLQGAQNAVTDGSRGARDRQSWGVSTLQCPVSAEAPSLPEPGFLPLLSCTLWRAGEELEQGTAEKGLSPSRGLCSA